MNTGYGTILPPPNKRGLASEDINSPALRLLELVTSAETPALLQHIVSLPITESADEHALYDFGVLIEQLIEEHSWTELYEWLLSHEINPPVALELITLGIGRKYDPDQPLDELNQLIGRVNRLTDPEAEDGILETQQDFVNWARPIAGNRKAQLKEQTAQLRAFNNIQDTLSSYQTKAPVPDTAFRLDRRVRQFKYTWNGQQVGAADLPVIFDQYRPTSLTPYSLFIDDNGGELRKVYTGRDLHLETLLRARRVPAHSVSFKIWRGIANDSRAYTLLNDGALGYSDVFLYADGRLVVIDEYPPEREYGAESSDHEGLFQERLVEAVPGLTLGLATDVELSGVYTLWNSNFNRELWNYALIQDPVLREFVYVNEAKEAAALKLNPTYEFLDIGARYYQYVKGSGSLQSQLRFRLTPKLLAYPATVTFTREQAREYPAQTTYVEVEVRKVNNRRALERFKRTLDFLFRHYIHGGVAERARLQLQRYDPLLTTLPARQATKGSRLINYPGVSTVNRRGRTKFDDLNDLDPQVFNEDYAVMCPPPNQPRILAETNLELTDTRTTTFKVGDEQEVVLYCPSESAAVMATVPSGDRPAPCCYPYNLEDAPSAFGGAYGRILKTLKLVRPGDRGKLPPAIEAMLWQAPGGTEARGYHRFGIIGDKNSFIHCVLNAVSPAYRSGNENEQRALAQEQRDDLYDYLESGPGVCLQELAGLDLEAVRKEVAGSAPLDPTLYYRYFEERYQANIFMFVTPKVDNGRERGTFHLPRSIAYHIRNYHERPAILVLFNRGLGRRNAIHNNRPQGHYELISARRGNGMTGLAFDPQVGYFVYQHAIEAQAQEVWRRSLDGQLYGYHNPSCFLNLNQVFGPPRAQQINEYGHAVVSYYRLGLPEEPGDQWTPLTIEHIPCQPDGAQETEPPFPVRSIELTRLEALLGPASGLRVNDQGLVTGVYFSAVGIDDALLVVQPGTVAVSTYQRDVQESLPIRLVRTSFHLQGLLASQGQVANYRYYRRTAAIVVELVRWVYDVYRTEVYPDANPIDFSDRYLPEVQPQAVKLDDLTYELIEDGVHYQTASELLLLLSDRLPVVDRQGYFVIGDLEFRNRLVDMLMDYHRNSPIPANILEKRHLNNYYYDFHDYRSYDYSQLLWGRANFATWVGVERHRRLPEVIDYFYVNAWNQLNPHSRPELATPYIYRYQDTYYLVVDIGTSFQPEAWSVYYQWLTDKRVISPVSDAEVVEPPYVLYQVGANGLVEPVEDHRLPSEIESDFCQVVRYPGPSPSYAVLLPLSGARHLSLLDV